MNFLESELAHRKALQLALVGSFLLFNMQFSLAQVTANQQSLSIDKLDKSSQISIKTAENKICPAANLLPIRSFETEKYYVYICRGDNQNLLGYYVRMPKSLDNNISVPITQKNAETEAYIATNGELEYQISPYEMVINKNGRTILREKVTNVVAANGQTLAKGCPQGNKTFAQAETQSFFIYICGGENPSNYLSITRTNNSIINIPLQKWNQSGEKTNQYVATNGEISFILTDKILRVSRNGRNVVKEKVLQWEIGNRI